MGIWRVGSFFFLMSFQNLWSHNNFILLQMGMAGNTSPFGQPFSQTGGQQMGATGVNPQLPNKPGMANSLPAFPADIKSTPVTSVPNMVSWTLLLPSVAVSSLYILNSGVQWVPQHYWTWSLKHQLPLQFFSTALWSTWKVGLFFYSNLTSKANPVFNEIALHPFILSGVFVSKPDENCLYVSSACRFKLLNQLKRVLVTPWTSLKAKQ